MKADLHTHSTESDGRCSPIEVVLEAHRRGLQVISVTDHDTFRGSIIARRKAREMGLEILVLLGAEIRTRDGDVLVLCPNEPLERIPLDTGELVEVAHERECLVIPAHPFDLWRYGIGDKVYDYRWDAIEVFNARSDPFSNQRAKKVAQELALPGIACSDAHLAEEVGVAFTIIEVEGLDEDEVLKAIKSGRVTPVPGRSSVRTIVKHLAWSLYDRVARRGERKRQRARLELWGFDEL